MPSRRNYELLPHTSSESSEDEESQFKDKPSYTPPRNPLFLLRKLRRAFRICRPIYVLILLILFLLYQTLFNASYTHPQPFTIDEKERIYIAANIVDGDLIRGDWGKSLKGLVELLGEDRVFVSIYGSPKDALLELAKELRCEKSIISEKDDPIDLSSLNRTLIPTTGESRIKRITFLAEARNKALKPLHTSTKKIDKLLFINDVFFQPKDAVRLLWGTNIQNGKAEYKAACAADFITSWKYYDTYATRDSEGYSIGVPIFPWFTSAGEGISRKDVLAGKEAVRVMSCWGGMVAFDGRYFQNQEKTIEEEQEDGVGNQISPTLPLSFRFEPEPFWDASECCLIHADLMASPSFTLSATSKVDIYDTGIYLNPSVRVSYSSNTYRFIPLAKRFERLFALPQNIINMVLHMPYFNPRRTETYNQTIKDRKWVSYESISGSGDDADADGKIGTGEFGGEEETWQGSGSTVEKREHIGKLKGKEYWDGKGDYENFERKAQRGGYCGVRQLLVIKEEGIRDANGGNWDKLLDEVPPVE